MYPLHTQVLSRCDVYLLQVGMNAAEHARLADYAPTFLDAFINKLKVQDAQAIIDLGLGHSSGPAHFSASGHSSSLVDPGHTSSLVGPGHSSGPGPDPCPTTAALPRPLPGTSRRPSLGGVSVGAGGAQVRRRGVTPGHESCKCVSHAQVLRHTSVLSHEWMHRSHLRL